MIEAGNPDRRFQDFLNDMKPKLNDWATLGQLLLMDCERLLGDERYEKLYSGNPAFKAEVEEFAEKKDKNGMFDCKFIRDDPTSLFYINPDEFRQGAVEIPYYLTTTYLQTKEIRKYFESDVSFSRMNFPFMRCASNFEYFL